MDTNDIDVLKQVRKALRDIRNTITDPHEKQTTVKALYQIDCLWALLETSTQRRQPWSYYQVRIEEEFGD